MLLESSGAENNFSGFPLRLCASKIIKGQYSDAESEAAALERSV
jgi:hypothetical protein